MEKECRLITGKLPQGDLTRNSEVRITDHPDMTSAVYCEGKTTNQTNIVFFGVFFFGLYFQNKGR